MRTLTLNVRLFFGVLVVMPPGSAWGTKDGADLAEDVSDQAFSDLSLRDLLNTRVQTVSRREQDISDAPAMVYVVTAEEIRERGYSTLKDVLHDLPGIGVHENYFSETGTLLNVRGIQGNNKVITLVNGVRINPPGNQGNRVLLALGRGRRIG